MDYHVANSTTNELTIMNRCLASYIVESPSESYINNTIAACVVNAVFFVLGCTLNLLVVVIFSVSKELRSKLSFFPILVLSSVDLATVIVVHPIFLLQAISEILKIPKCTYKVAYFSVLYIFPGISASTLLLMNIERYIAIARPLWHLRIGQKKQKFVCACVVCWLLMVANLICRLFKPPYSKAFTMVGISIACLITLFTYASIFKVSRTRRSLPLQEQTSSDATQETRKNKTSFIHDLKIAKIYFLVVMLSFICYLPTGVVVFATKYPWRENEAKRTLLAQVYTWTNTFISLTSTLNCLVFFWANERLRKEAWKLWKGLVTSEQSPSSSGSEARL